MKFRRIALWAFIDVLGTSLGVALLSVNPPKAQDGVKQDALYLITADWPLEYDDDVDLWLVKPDRRPVFYGARDVGCSTLDRDSRGFMDSRITLADGSQAQVSTYKETTTIRCIESGQWDVGVNWYGAHHAGKEGPVPVHIEIVGLNPRVQTLASKDVTLEGVGETINVVSFVLARDGTWTAADVPLESVTARYQRMRMGGYQ